MQPIKKAIFGEIRKINTDTESVSDDELNSILFYHRDSLRLTLTGFVQLKAIFTVYSFEIPETLKTRHRFGLSKMEFPYFFTKKRLILFSEMDAAVIELRGGIESFLESYAQIDN